jgi:alpha-mannosidase
VILTALKHAEDGDNLVARFYEWAGKEGDVELQFAEPADSAEEVNLMEQPIRQLSVAKRKIAIRLNPYEIQTMRVRFHSK